MFLNEPQSTHRYYGELLKAYSDKVFKETHNLYPYYCSGYAYALLDSFFRQQELDNRKYGQFRFHLLMLFRLLTESNDLALPSLNNKKMEKYCQQLFSILSSDHEALQIFQKAVNLIDKTLKKVSYSSFEASRRKEFTLKLIDHFESFVIPAQVDRESGTIKWFSEISVRLKGSVL